MSQVGNVVEGICHGPRTHPPSPDKTPSVGSFATARLQVRQLWVLLITATRPLLQCNSNPASICIRLTAQARHSLTLPPCLPCHLRCPPLPVCRGKNRVLNTLPKAPNKRTPLLLPPSALDSGHYYPHHCHIRQQRSTRHPPHS